MITYPLQSCSHYDLRLSHMLSIDRSPALVDHVVTKVSTTIIQALEPSNLPSTTSQYSDPIRLPKFTAFVQETIARSNVAVRVILVSLVYINRIAPLLHLPTERYARERIFIGALVLANKYTNDSSIRNRDWSKCTRLFSPRDVGRMEREFLEIVDYDLSVTEDDLLNLYDSLLPPVSPPSSILSDSETIVGDGSLCPYDDSDDDLGSTVSEIIKPHVHFLSSEPAHELHIPSTAKKGTFPWSRRKLQSPPRKTAAAVAAGCIKDLYHRPQMVQRFSF